MSVVAPAGFVASGVASGIKPAGELDLALVATAAADLVPVAGVFTSNLAAAAPVQVSRAHLSRSGGRAAAVVLNSGCANAATGVEGLRVAERSCGVVGEQIGVAAQNVLVCSTGVIGTQLPLERVEAAAPALAASLGSDPVRGAAGARAILTTDTRTKQVVVEADGFVVGGMGKGAAMLAPNLATMLAVLTTDATVSSEQLHRALATAVAGSFNELTVDGCTSTNDSVIAMASCRGPAVPVPVLTEALVAACADLAAQMAADAEGGTKVVRVRVVGAVSDEAARRAARQVAQSNLVKCSWYGEDANWGRVLSELGAAGTPLEPDVVSISYGPVTVCRAGVAAGHDADALRAVLAAEQIEIVCDLGIGDGTGTVLSADLTHAYVDENMGRS